MMEKRSKIVGNIYSWYYAFKHETPRHFVEIDGKLYDHLGNCISGNDEQ